MMRMNSTAPTSALLLFAHGSSDPGWAKPFVRLRAAIQARDPARRVELAYLERMQPSFDEVVNALHAEGVTEITVAPIFLALGGHLRNDLPNMIAATRQRTAIRFRVLPALGESEALIHAIADWVDETAAAGG